MHIPYPRFLAIEDLPEGIDLPQISRSTAAGIGVAIAGNILISLALNCQKLAHRRLEREREAAAQAPRPLQPTRSNGQVLDGPNAPYEASANETAPLLLNARGIEGEVEGEALRPRRRWFFLRRTQSSPYHAHTADRTHLASTHALMPVDVAIVRSRGTAPHLNDEPKEQDEGANESDYLKSKLWWLGFLLMNLGEMGNFISYAFAPASLVAPLGTFALIANCIFAPVMLKERFRKRDFVGIIIAILGAVTVVLSANPSDTRLDPDGLIEAMTQRPFEIYALVYVIGIVILSGLSEGPAGKRWVYVDVGLCALFGGFTVLSTKALSTLLTMEWFEIFKEWITYPVIAVLLGTGVGQIRYLNRALMRFDSKIVVPTQFVMFNLSAIVGSALLYGDFKKATFHQLVNFLYGCGATFAGVFIIAWAPATRPADEDEDELDEDEDADTIHTTATLPPSRSDGPSSGTATLSEDSAAPTSVRTVKVGSVFRRTRTTWAVPDGMDGDGMPVLRNRHSMVSLYGFSPAQRVLLMGSSPREEFVRPNLQERDPEREAGASPDSFGRRRAVNWLEGDVSRQASPLGVGVAARRYGATSNATSREQSRTGDRRPLAATSRSRSASPDPFM